MRRRAKPAKAKARAKLPVAEKVRKDAGRLAETLKREAEALEQQAATSEILRVISSSPADAQPVFDAIAVNALRLCDAEGVVVARYDGVLLHVAAHHNVNRETADRLERQYPRAPDRHVPLGRAVLDGAVVHVPDLQAAVEFSGSVARQLGAGSQVAIPLLHHGRAVGGIGISRRKRGPFSDRQIALLKTFADQAVIAIENVRLFNETKEALERQTATSEILRVISSSPTNVQPVLDAVAESATRLCGATDALIYRVEAGMILRVAHFGPVPSVSDARPTTRETITGRSIIERRAIHVHDLLDEFAHGEYAETRSLQGGIRTVLCVPLTREDSVLGAITIRRMQVDPFAEPQIELLKTFADQAVIAIENVRLFKELQQKNEALTQAHAQVTEALERQTATSEILRVISSSPTDVNPVFRTILANTNRLCDASFSVLWLWDGEAPTAVAHENVSPAMAKALRTARPLPNRRNPLGLSILEQTVVHIADVPTDPRFTPEDVPSYRLEGARSILLVPMVREGSLVGVINIWRRESRAFTDAQIDLLKTFADQAVIAIENVRLFTETKEALEQQTATSEILRVISSSPTDFQPVFDTIVRHAGRVCNAFDAVLVLVDGDDFVLRAHSGPIERAPNLRYPLQGTVGGRAILEARVIQVENLAEAVDYPIGQALAQRSGYRTTLSVPLLREGAAIGAITIRRTEVLPFSDKQIALLRTFADQAVIAIENVRLFTELQASNRELTTALDQQTATSDILKVISRSQADVQPVFDAIVDSAVRLLGAYSGGLTRITGDLINLVALTSIDDPGDAAQRARFPQSLHSEGEQAQAIRNRAPLNIADAQTDPRLPETAHAAARARGFRSLVAVPMLRHDEAIGTIAVSRRKPGGFTDDEIALLKTFADQAVIAIENARLLTELHARTAELTQSVGELRALGEVGQAISSTLDLQTVLSTIVTRATQLAGADAGVIYEYDAEREVFEPRATEHLEPEIVEVLVTAPVRKGEGATGQLAISPEAVQLPDIHIDSLPSLHHARGAFVRAGYRALLAVPLLREDHLIGGLTVLRKMPGEFPRETIELLQTFATQSALAIQNARLFREIEDKSRQLEAASQHKSEFLANMSHELRTPLNAIIGFSEVLGERMFGELNEKQAEYLQDIYASGTHLLSLINDILDLSKIEAGRMELELTDFDLPQAIDNALTLVRERAGRRSLALQMSVDERLGEIRADERKVRQVVLNLLSNAIKFTPEGGRIEVRAVPKDGSVEVSVSDTGVGIAPEDQEAVFEEFRQVGTADKKVEGTGLGLTLCRKFVELHGGRIWVKSELGVGSTFTFTLPVLRGE